MLRLVASLLLVLASFAAPTYAATAQESDDPATSVDATFSTETIEEDASNLPALLIGAVLLGAGVWAYMNKKKRFPGARFRD